jgi:hypothetical protein
MIHAPGASGLPVPGVETAIRVDVGRVQVESEGEVWHTESITAMAGQPKHLRRYGRI